MLSKKESNGENGLKEWTAKTKQETSKDFPLELHQRLAVRAEEDGG